jgi:multidrug resistance efflux pump
VLELLLCSLVTILPDYLYRRYGQGKRIGREITLYSVWFELRWGIVTCLFLTVTLITIIFYFHPSTNSAVSYFRTIPILPEGSGRVAEVYVGLRDEVRAGQALFRLDSAKQEAAMETARRQVAEIDAAIVLADADMAVAEGKIREAEGAHKQAVDELDTKLDLQERNPGIVATREIEKLQNVVDARQGALSAAQANKQSIETQISTVLPARKASAEAALEQAQVELDKTIIYAGVDGTLEQFALRVGDVVNPMMRPAGVLIPAEAGRQAVFAGFDQIEAQVMKVGMIAEIACISKPFSVIPMVVTQVQEVIAAGQIRPTDVLADPLQSQRPGTITVVLEPLFAGGLDSVPPGSNCIANAYTNNHDLLAEGDLGIGRRIFLHAVDTVAVVHAVILRIQTLVLPVRTLVFSGH